MTFKCVSCAYLHTKLRFCHIKNGCKMTAIPFLKYLSICTMGKPVCCERHYGEDLNIYISTCFHVPET